MTHTTHLKPSRSPDLLKELHILTVSGKLNADSNRKLKQINHLCGFLEPIISKLSKQQQSISLVDMWCGKSYLWFMLYDLYLKQLQNIELQIIWIDNRPDLITNSIKLADKLHFDTMSFIEDTIQWANTNKEIPEHIDIITALHACDTATDDSIHFWLSHHAKYIVLVPCCQADVCTLLTKNKSKALENNLLSEIRRHPIHTRSFASHLTNVIRCLWLEASGYSVSVTELVWREHSMKNELIIAEHTGIINNRSRKRLDNTLKEFWLWDIADRFTTILTNE
jgi:Methyltransferase domain